MVKYDWKKTAKKVGIVAVEVILAGLIAYASEQPAWIGLVPVFEGIRNWFKHR